MQPYYVSAWQGTGARTGVPVLDRAEGVFTLLEHEAMHQETLLYMWHRLPHAQKHRPADVRYELDGATPAYASIRIPAGDAGHQRV